MPKLIDQDARRRHIADTVVRIIGTRGDRGRHRARRRRGGRGVRRRGAAVLRDPGRAAALRAAAHQRRFTARVTAGWPGSRTPPTRRSGLRVVIDEMLPVDAERRLTSAATLALLAYSATEPQAAEVMRDRVHRRAHLLHAGLHRGVGDRALRGDHRPAGAADRRRDHAGAGLVRRGRRHRGRRKDRSRVSTGASAAGHDRED